MNFMHKRACTHISSHEIDYILLVIEDVVPPFRISYHRIPGLIHAHTSTRTFPQSDIDLGPAIDNRGQQAAVRSLVLARRWNYPHARTPQLQQE
jgi:hypothetical protein